MASIESTTSSELEDKISDEQELMYSPIVDHVLSRFREAEDHRRTTETRWSKAWINYRGHYNDTVKFTSTEKSQAFVKITKTKVVAGAGQIFDIIYADGKLPISIIPSPVPEGIAEKAHVDSAALQGQGGQPEQEVSFGFLGDDDEPAPGAGLLDRLKDVVKPIFGKLPFIGGSAKQGEFEISPAQIAANAMNLEVHDQLAETNAVTAISKAIYEGALLGSGCIKGPFTTEREYPSWTVDAETGKATYNPTIKRVPDIEQVSIWALYPDPDATSMEDAEFIIQRHRLTDFQLRQLQAKPGFRKDVIDEIIMNPQSEENTTWEDVLREDITASTKPKHIAYEFWGNVETSAFGEEFEKDLPEDLRDHKNIQVNIWVSNHKIIRMAINPFLPKRIPYHIFHHEADLYNFFGIGIAENMEDAQSLVNGFWRLAIDNAALSGNMIFEVDEMNLVPGQDMTIYPGKIFRRKQGAPGQAVFAHSFKSTSNENLAMMQEALKVADISTGIPAASHGAPPGTAGRTAMGMSMMLGAAGLNTKTVIRNLDQQLFKPIGDAYFAWNMQFSDRKDIKGDLKVIAKGIDNLLQKEVKSQRLLQFLQVATANPNTAPLANSEYLLKQIAITLDMDPEEVINSPAKQKAMAALIAQTQGGGAQQQQGESGPMSVQDQTGGGGGQMGIGTPITPGSEQSNQPSL
ncbi:MAG: hypothetical protein QQN63_00070 [Nitrosopumilus sp.]